MDLNKGINIPILEKDSKGNLLIKAGLHKSLKSKFFKNRELD
jgi:hypothetical protein